MDSAGGVYEICNLTNGKRYIGSTYNFKKRWRQHRRELERGAHCSSRIQNAWTKYGGERFTFRPLIICANRDLLMYEQIAIDAFQPEYNICRTAGRSQLGLKRSDETRERCRLAQLGKQHSAESRAKNSAANKGMVFTAEHRAKITAAKLGKKHSVERCAINSACHIGKKHSEETRRKMSMAQLARFKNQDGGHG